MQLCITVVFHSFTYSLNKYWVLPIATHYFHFWAYCGQQNRPKIHILAGWDRSCVYVCVVIWGKIKQRREVRNWEEVEFLSRMAKHGLPVVTWDEGLKKVKGVMWLSWGRRGQQVLVSKPRHVSHLLGTCKTRVAGVKWAGRRADINSGKAPGPVARALACYSEQRSWWRISHKDATGSGLSFKRMRCYCVSWD